MKELRERIIALQTKMANLREQSHPDQAAPFGNAEICLLTEKWYLVCEASSHVPSQNEIEAYMLGANGINWLYAMKMADILAEHGITKQ